MQQHKVTHQNQLYYVRLIAVATTLTIYGHDDIKTTLKVLPAHTLLFVGPERVGRRLMAKWYAAWLNCEQVQTEAIEKPCHNCRSCQAFLTNSHPDYREITPELETKTGKLSRRPQFRIDDLVHREGGRDNPLGQWLNRRPRFKKRVGVIDHAEALNASAANAFLKLLEEPPSYAVIILIAPSTQAVLPTIASRAIPIPFSTVKTLNDEKFKDTEFKDKGLTQTESTFQHPAIRLGRYGDIVLAQENQELFLETTNLIEKYLQSLAQNLDAAFELADSLEKRWLNSGVFSIPELLRAKFSEMKPNIYARAILALESCEQAITSYASPSLALQVLTLELRNIIRQ